MSLLTMMMVMTNDLNELDDDSNKIKRHNNKTKI